VTSVAGAATDLPAVTLGANATRVLRALGLGDALEQIAHIPDREQIRLGRSGYLLAELPLAKFYADRYGARLINIEQHELAGMLNAELAKPCDSPLHEIARHHQLVIMTASEPAETSGQFSFFHARMPRTKLAPQCNVTWLLERQVAWEFSTQSTTHFFFSTPIGCQLKAMDWHPTIQDAVAQATPIAWPVRDGIRQHWVEGNLVYSGHASYPTTAYFRESLSCGFEDAWVLSRMLENYEEDMHDGLSEYARYRQVRARKITRETESLTASLTQPVAAKRIMRNLGIALSTRFLPEIAMSRRDWFHSYDRIKGFR